MRHYREIDSTYVPSTPNTGCQKVIFLGRQSVRTFVLKGFAKVRLKRSWFGKWQIEDYILNHILGHHVKVVKRVEIFSWDSWDLFFFS